MSGAFLIDAIAETAARLPDHLALQVYDDKQGGLRYTYAQMMDHTLRLSRSLRSRGVSDGDRVVFWARLTPRWVLAYLGALHNGCVVVPLDLECSVESLAAVLAETGARIVFTTREKADQLGKRPELFAEPPQLVSLDLDEDHGGITPLASLLEGPPASRAAERPADAIATIFYTSGATGKPKGVVVTHRGLTVTVHGLLSYLEGSPADNVLALVPSHHVLASVANILLPLVKGASVTYLRALNSGDLLAALRGARVTILPGVPQLFYLLHKRILEEVQRKSLPARLLFASTLKACRRVRLATGLNPGRLLFARVHRAFGGSLRLLVSAASPFDPDVVRDFYGLGFTVAQGYALTETSGGGTFTPWFANRLGSVGKAIPGVEIKLVDVDASGVGEIAIAGPTVMKGYFNSEPATAEAVRDGWFHTGDLGTVDPEGNYYITGRKKEVVVLSSGKKVHPEEIELHYSRLPAIKEIGVLGIRGATEYGASEQLHAVIVPDFDYLRAQKMVSCRDAVREGVALLSAGLPPHKRILSYQIRTVPLPRTSTGKLMRYVLVEEAGRNGGNESDAAPSPYVFVAGDDTLEKSEVAQRVLAIIARESGCPRPLHLGMNLELDLGFDSLQRIELLAQVEQAAHVELGEDAASRILTIRDLLRLVADRVDTGPSAAPATPHENAVTWREILAAAPADEATDRYVLRTSGAAILAHYLFLRTAYGLAKVLFRLRVRGLENLPRRRPFLICPNHQSYIDGVLVPAVLPYRVFKHVFSLGLTAFFTGGIRDLIARVARIVPIDPDTNVVRATRISAAGLKAGQNLLIFPEGSLSCDGELQLFKKGAAVLAREIGVPIVPVGVSGSFHVWSKPQARIRLAPITITFGPPIQPDGLLDGPADREAEYDALTLRLRDAIAQLVKES